MTEGSRAGVVTVVLNWRRPDETELCVRSVLAGDYPGNRIVVIDNSAGTTGIEVRLAGLPVEIVRNPANLGFTGGVNVGLLHALERGADYVWLVNSDATVAPGALGRMVAMAEADPGLGLVSPVIEAPNAAGEVVFCVGLQSRDNVASDGTADPAVARAWLRERPGEAVLYGAALVIRRDLAERIGGLDERFFAYVEDLDYSLRCHDAGYAVGVCFEAVAYHRFKDLAASDVAPYVRYFMSRNPLLLWGKRNGGAMLRRPVMWFVHRRLLGLDRGDRAAGEAILLGLWDGLRGRGGAFDPARRAPWGLRRTVGRHPGWLLNLLERKAPWRRRGGR